jgi:hypothetical protein
MRVPVLYGIEFPRENRQPALSLEKFLRQDGVKARVVRENPIPISPETAHNIFVHLEPILDGLVVAAVGSVAKWAMNLRKSRKFDPKVQNFRVIIPTDKEAVSRSCTSVSSAAASRSRSA